MKNKQLLFSGFLVLSSVWWAWTFLVDFFVVRTVFAHVSSFFEAGSLGIAVFSKLNNLEVVCASALTGLTSLQVMRNKKSVKFLMMSIVGWLIVMFYFIYLTPKITGLTELWKAAEAAGQTGAAGISDLQQEHQFYHKLYIGLDSFKLLLLTVMISMGAIKQEEWS